MFTFQAPYPSLQTTTILPNPKFGDAESLRVSIVMKRTIDGTRYTYIKRRGGKKLQWTFRLTRNKSLELRAFIQSYFASTTIVTDHNDRKWIGNFTNNPFELSTDSRAAPAIAPMPRGESVNITLEFEGDEQL